MEEEIVSGISSVEVNNATSNEFSDSISTSHHPGNKRKRFGSNGGSASEFKGLIRLKNGQWGSQLYANHERIWLGTFKSETDAAMAYDSAALVKFRSADDTHRNFPWTEVTRQELKFQSLHSAEAVLNMIRDGSYRCKFMDFLKVRPKTEKLEIDFSSVRTYCNNGVTCKQLFQKQLTRSDVGKFSRLVIPKKYALKYFPPIAGNGTENVHGEDGTRIPKDTDLDFYDKEMKLWKFRYCSWNSSRSFVFTRGWNSFLKEKELKASDVIFFYICESTKDQQVRTFCMIDVNKDGNGDSLLQVANMQVKRETDLQLWLRRSFGFDCENEKHVKQGVKQETELMAGFKLFGKQITDLQHRFDGENEKNIKQEPQLLELLPKQAVKQETEAKQAPYTKGFKLFGKQIKIIHID